MELLTSEGEDAVVGAALEGDAVAIGGDELRAETLGAVGTTPRAGGREGG